MQNIIGEKLETVINHFLAKGIKFAIIDNNFNVDGDTKLVTNIYTKDDVVYLVIGNFIFNLKDSKNENK